jgi:adenylate cyclase class 2
MDHLEIEVKFYLDRFDPFRRKVIELGGVSTGPCFETNFRYEDDGLNLIKQGALLRLRKDAKTTLTYKASLPQEDREYKVHRELEVEVDDFDKMNRILEYLGFHRETIYEKWREVFTLKNVQFCFDQMPFGRFLEIEGTKDDIRYYTEKLNLNWRDRITMNYLSIFKTLRHQLNLSFSDVTFDNFESIDPHEAQWIPMIKAEFKHS